MANSFETYRAEVRRLADRRNMDPAYRTALEMTKEHPHDVNAWFLLNYVVCVSGRGGGPLHGSSRLIVEGVRYKNLPRQEVLLIVGDMKRDRAIGLIRFAESDVALRVAEGIIDSLRHQPNRALGLEETSAEHTNDPNQLAVLRDVKGRLFYTRRQYRQAVQEHAGAHHDWMEIQAQGGYVDFVWVYNNQVHWLKALMKVPDGRRSPLAKWLVAQINRGCKGSRNRSNEASVIRVPVMGNLVHDWITRHR